MQKILLWMLIADFLVFSTAMRTSAEPGEFRTAYFQLRDTEQDAAQLQRLRLHGFNTVLVADGRYPLQEELWQRWATLARQSDLQLLPVLNFAVPQEFKNVQGRFRPYVDRDGVIYPATPCPVDEAYWNAVIGARFERLATLSRSAPIAGAVFDAEMYGSDISLYTDLCYCDACWQEFCATSSSLPPNSPSIAQGERFDYLITHHLLQEYTTIQWSRLYAILAQIEERIHALQPTFSLGFLCYRHNWFFTALVQGLGTPANPVLVFSESSYVLGYTPYVDREQDAVLGNQPIARYIPGVWLARFFPRDLPAQLCDLAIHTDGYWIYTADSLWAEASPVPENNVHDHPIFYWQAFEQSNAEIIRLSGKTADAADRHIPPVRQSSFYEPAQRRLFRAPALKQVLSQLPGITDEVLSIAEQPPIYRGRTLFHCLSLMPGSIQITCLPLRKDTDPDLVAISGENPQPIPYLLFDDAGRIVQEGEIGSSEPVAQILLPEAENHIYSLFLTSGSNGVRVDLSDAACVIEASSTFPLETYKSAQQYALYVTPDTEWLRFRAHTPKQEAVSITVQSPDQQVRQHTVMSEYLEFQSECPLSTRQAFWRITTAQVPSTPFADVRWYLYDAEFPYVMILPTKHTKGHEKEKEVKK